MSNIVYLSFFDCSSIHLTYTYYVFALSIGGIVHVLKNPAHISFVLVPVAAEDDSDQENYRRRELSTNGYNQGELHYIYLQV